MAECLSSLESSGLVVEAAAWQSAPGQSGLSNRVAATAPTGVLIGQVSALSLHGMEAIVAGHSAFRVAGLTRSLEDLIAGCEACGDGVALVDPMLGQLGVSAFMAAIRNAAPRLRVVLVTDLALPAVVRAGVEGGALGVLCSRDDLFEIRDALIAVSRGRRYLSRSMAEQLSLAMTYDTLTQREMEVLRMLSKGCCNKTLARELDVTVGTVKTHLRAIMCKLAASSRMDTLLKAGNLGLIHV
ncbi:response regulator transcription factor [Paucibacter sp. R3-3]|uniref:Response regulator transcription factor n=1 Tax=Roseateles agri TaxID=3098619 RepID=A0ABU5DT18_9BURK|nr:response regulator transcription factor [Paucibacter sp. R3-3]MDY0749043.1 response regulator transcription factor [Paucibacter sp. R3-3]